MSIVMSALKKGERAIISDYEVAAIPLKLIEMGCLVGNMVTLIQRAPMNDPLYLNINDTYLAIRSEIAAQILVDKI